MNLAIIPARGGSKRIPRKNIRPFRGLPMLVWSLRAALASKLFDEVMVSTDDDEIAAVARAHGAEVPFMRSAKASDDYATTADVLIEVLDAYRARTTTFELACCLYPAAPFTTAADLVEGHRRLTQGPFDVIMPVVAFESSIWRSLKRLDNGKIVPNFPENLNTRTQDLPAAYHDAGQWYWFRVPVLERDGNLMASNSGSIVIPGQNVQDIDTEEDWELAELKHERLFG